MYDAWLCGVGNGLSALSFEYFIFLSSMCYLEVVLAIRDSLPRNVSCLISHSCIVHYLPCTVGVEA